MPQLIALALAGAGLYAGYRWVSREIRRALAATHDAREEGGRENTLAAGSPKDLGSLEWDAESGVYRPSRRL